MGLPFIKEAVSQLFSKPSTECYPAVPKEAPERYRGRIVYYPDRCIDCGMCERVCAGGAITKTVEETEEGKLITRRFYLGSCTFCSCCADFCAKKAIELSKDYHMVARCDDDLVVSGTFLKKAPVKPPIKPAEPAPASSPVSETK
jgi:NADH-quinone oxidoreductase subunit I